MPIPVALTVMQGLVGDFPEGKLIFKPFQRLKGIFYLFSKPQWRKNN
jgi:hypothetical protein